MKRPGSSAVCGCTVGIGDLTVGMARRCLFGTVTTAVIVIPVWVSLIGLVSGSDAWESAAGAFMKAVLCAPRHLIWPHCVQKALCEWEHVLHNALRFTELEDERLFFSFFGTSKQSKFVLEN